MMMALRRGQLYDRYGVLYSQIFGGRTWILERACLNICIVLSLVMHESHLDQPCARSMCGEVQALVRWYRSERTAIGGRPLSRLEMKNRGARCDFACMNRAS